MRNKVISLLVVATLILGLLPMGTFNVYATETSAYSPYAKIECAYSATVSCGTIRYIAQMSSSKYFYDAYWGSWKSKAGSECGTSCISMSLSFVGINKLPKNILDEGSGKTYFGRNWGGVVAKSYTAANFKTAVDCYVDGNGQYSPPIIHLNKYSSAGHFVIVIGRISNDVYQVMDPGNSKVYWNMTISGTTATYNHPKTGTYITDSLDRSGRTDDIYQYYNENAANINRATLDINGYLDGAVVGDLSNYGTFDVWVNGSLVADNVNDYCVDWPVGTQYEITDIRATDVHKYLGVGAGSLSGTVGPERTDVYLQFRTLDNIGDDFYAYIINKGNGSYAHNQGDQNVTAPQFQDIDNKIVLVWHFQRLEDGTYKITSAWNGLSMDVQGYGTTPGTNLISFPYSGNDAQRWCIFQEDWGYKLSAVCTPCVVAVNTATGNIQMEQERNELFDQWFYIEKISSEYYLDVNGYLDGAEMGHLSNYGTFDVLINGSLVADDVNDYCVDWPVGTSYEITDIRETDGHKYLGVGSGSLSGTVGVETMNVYLQFRAKDDIGDDFYARIRSQETGNYVYNQGDNNVTCLPLNDSALEQIWHFKRLEDGTYKIISAWNGYALDVHGYGSTPGTNVNAYPYEGNTAQRWCIFQENAGYKFSAVCTPCVLFAESSTTNVFMASDQNERSAQWFAIEKISTSYSWDVNGLLDGKEAAGTDGYGTFDVWLNGTQVADDVPDYFAGELPIGTTYEIRDIRVKEGRSYNGVHSGSLSGTIGGNHVFTVLNFSTAQPAQVGEPAGEATANGHKYVYYADKTTWYAANAFCEAQGGHLITITSQEENDLLTFLCGEDDIWLGATDVKTEGQWEWITGEPFEYANWNSGEPNNAAVNIEYSEHYLMTYEIGWNDIHGCAEYGFVMEIEPGLLDVNADLDGQPQQSLSGYATVDVYVDGQCVADDVEDYREYLSAGAEYEIRDIRPADGYSYDGLYSGVRTGKMSGAGQTVVLKFSRVQYDVIGEPEAELTWNGHRYVYYPVQTTWYAAKALCEKLGGHLVTISSNQEESIVSILASEAAWTGGTDATNEGTWQWITEEPFDYNNWRASTNEPNNSIVNDEGAENYLVWEPAGWNDNPGHRLASFICEFDAYSGFTVEGTVISSGGDEDEITVALSREGSNTVEHTAVLRGNCADYSISNVQPGVYTMRVNKKHHVTRTYTVTVASGNLIQDVQIGLLGDITGDGRINIGDVSRLYSHIRGVNKITDEYLLECANVVGGGLNIADVSNLYAHVKGTNKLW